MSDKDDNKSTYYVAANGYKQYFTFDEERNEATPRGGKPLTLPRERLADFLHTAKMLGLAVGKDGCAL